MKVAIMQPYFLPYIGYFQLIDSVDIFVMYDNIKYTKKGWINRNRILVNGKDEMFSIPLRNDSDYLNVNDRELAVDFNPRKLLNQIAGAYSKAPYFKQTFPLIEQIMMNEERNLFKFIHQAVILLCEHLSIKTKIAISSKINVNHALKSQDKVISICNALNASTYINSIGGVDLYSKDDFLVKRINLKFIKSVPFEYTQFKNEYVPWLSIVDVMMFNPLSAVQNHVKLSYELS